MPEQKEHEDADDEEEQPDRGVSRGVRKSAILSQLFNKSSTIPRGGDSGGVDGQGKLVFNGEREQTPGS